MSDEWSYRGCDRGYHVDENEPQEQYEVLVVAVAQAIIDIDAVMIKFLHASPTYHAMKSSRRLDHFAIETEILQVNIPVMTHLKQINDTEVSPDVAWIWAVADQVEDHRQKEEKDT